MRLVLRFEAWLEAHPDLAALIVISIGFLIRLKGAASGWLNPDEIIHFMAGDQPTLAAVCREGLTCQHPPVHYLLNFFWRHVGRSDFVLRIPSLLMGTALLWVVFRSLSRTLGRTAGLIGLGLFTFAPEIVLVSTEVRGYAILLLLVFGALACLVRAFEEESTLMMAAFTGLLLLALLTDFSAIMFALAVGAYALMVIVRRRPGPRVRNVWLAGQVLVLALCIVLYVTQISRLQNFGAQQFAREDWLRASYFHPGKDSILLFPFRNTLALFQFMFSSRLLGVPALLLFVAGLVLLWRQREPTRPGRPEYALLVLLPFVVADVIALTGATPYGGTRHSLLPGAFGFVGVSYALARILDRRRTAEPARRACLGPVLLGVLVLGPAWSLTARTAPDWYIAPQDQRRELMTRAMDYVRQVTPANRIVFGDEQSQVLLTWYLCPGQVRRAKLSPKGFLEFDCPEYRLVSPAVWTFTVDSSEYVVRREFADEFFRLREAYNLKPGDSVCVVSAGWGENLATKLSRRHPVSYPGLRRFGAHISVFVVPVGSEQFMDRQAQTEVRIRRALDSLAAALPSATKLRLRTVLWPTYYFAPGVHDRLMTPVSRVFPYAEFYRGVQSDQSYLEQSLPALAFWVFGTAELHIHALAIMDGRETYQLGDYGFALIAADPDSLVGVYLIRPVRSPWGGPPGGRSQ